MQKKPDYYYQQSAVIPFKKVKGEIFVLLITSKNKNKWIIPKGIIEQNMSSRKSAKKEAFEEAGIIGKTSKKSIGYYKFKKWGSSCSVEVFLLKVKKEFDEWDEMLFRQRKWFPIEKAIVKINPKKLQILIRDYFINPKNKVTI